MISQNQMKNYDHIKIEKKWQKEWETKKIYKTEQNSKKPKQYILDMFPYPSGAGLHVGHPRGYIGSDVYARMKRMEGFNVLHPMGYDAFGLPAEQYAITHKIHPRQAVEKNVKTFEKQLSIIGLSYDWSRKVNTTDPEYYKWTEWIFIQIYNSWYDKNKDKARPIPELVKIFEKNGNTTVNAVCNNNVMPFSGRDWKDFSALEQQSILMQYRLAYEGHAEVNWCPELGTVLANDEVLDGPNGTLVSERGGYLVEKKSMRQWFMRITAYADRLINGLESLDWSSHIKEIQKNWIGKSEGSEIPFKIIFENGGKTGTIPVFTTRADTLFGVTYIVLAPEHPWVTLAIDDEHKAKGVLKNTDEVREYVASVKNKSTEERIAGGKEKTGIKLEGVMAINPANGEAVPVYVADYVLASYGTGAVMAVPAHDERDFEFAKKFGLPIKQVIAPYFEDFTEECKPRNDKNKKIRKAVVALVKHWSEDKYICLQWKKQNWRTLVTGGIEEGETVEETIKRELLEETGYKNIKNIVHFPQRIISYFFASHKDINMMREGNFLFVELENGDRDEISDEEKDKHEVMWVDREKIIEFLDYRGKEYDIRDAKYFINKFSSNEKEQNIFEDSGMLIDSKQFDGLTSDEAKKKITEFVGGKIVSKYKMRDAIFARQRYWGEPIPLIHKKDGMIETVSDKKLPLELPNVKSYEPTGTGESPLAGVKSWMDKGYETNTMPGWAGSSWYFLRYTDPKNKKELASKKSLDYWFGKKNGGVDMYVGGAEHATGHLLYSRFWHKFLYDMGIVKTDEPFKALRNQGMIGGADGRKMSKRWGNVINPDDVVKTYGADTLRVYESFMGPFDQALPWSTESIIGSRRFVEKVWRLSAKVASSENKFSGPRGKSLDAENLFSDSAQFQTVLHKTIKKVTEDIASFSFNTAVSSMMICVNEMERQEKIDVKDFKMFLQILAPFASHMTEELWHELGEKKSIHLSKWPKWDAKKVVDEQIKIAVSVNGKVRGEILVAPDMDEDLIKVMAQRNNSVMPWIEGKEIKRIIYVKGRIINIVV